MFEYIHRNTGEFLTIVKLLYIYMNIVVTR